MSNLFHEHGRWRLRILLSLLIPWVSGCGAPLSDTERWLERLGAQSAATDLSLWTPDQPGARAATEQLAWYVLWVAQGGPEALPELLQQGNRLAARIDPVWGGVLEQRVESLSDSGGESGSESIANAKTMISQALSLEAFATLYWATGEQRFANAYRLVDDYVQDWLRLRDGGYALAQRSRPQRLRPGLTPADYWSTRREHERRSLGIPAVHGRAVVRTELALARAYLIAADALDDLNYLAEARALLAAPVNMAEQACSSAPLRLALRLQLWQRQGDAQTLLALRAQGQELIAGRLAADLCEQVDAGAALSRVDLALALQQLNLLSADLTTNTAPHRLLQQALRWLQGADTADQLPILLAGRRLTDGPLVYLLTGAPSDPRWQYLQSLARAIWRPRSWIVPRSDRGASPAVLHICNVRGCALPLPVDSDPAPNDIAVHKALEQLPAPGGAAISAQIPAILGLPNFLNSSQSGVVP